MNLDQLNNWSALWLDSILRATWQGSIFIGVVWLACRYLRALSPQMRYWIWWIASLQLVCRLFLVTPIAVPILPPQRVTPQMSVERTVDLDLPDPMPSKPTPSSATLVFGVWVLGMGVCAARGVRRISATKRLLANAIPITDPLPLQMVDDLARRSQVNPPRLLESAKAPCPLLAGLIHPKIVLPSKNGCRPSTAEELRMAIAHEITHLQRRDLWFAIVPVVARSVFFFHPLAWLSVREVSGACEEACDIQTLQLSGGSPIAYARLLLKSAQNGESLAAMGAAFRYRMLHRRITMINSPLITQYRRAGMLLIALGIVATVPWKVTAQTSPPAPIDVPSVAVASLAPQQTVTAPVKIRTRYYSRRAVRKHRTRRAVRRHVRPRSLDVVVRSAAPAYTHRGKAVVIDVYPTARPYSRPRPAKVIDGKQVPDMRPASPGAPAPVSRPSDPTAPAIAPDVRPAADLFIEDGKPVRTGVIYFRDHRKPPTTVFAYRTRRGRKRYVRVLTLARPVAAPRPASRPALPRGRDLFKEAPAPKPAAIPMPPALVDPTAPPKPGR